MLEPCAASAAASWPAEAATVSWEVAATSGGVPRDNGV
jgi:hypothetical protein